MNVCLTIGVTSNFTFNKMILFLFRNMESFIFSSKADI